MARNPEVTITIDHLTVTGDGATIEARDVVLSASGPDSYAVANAVHTQLVTLLNIGDRTDDEAQR